MKLLLAILLCLTVVSSAAQNNIFRGQMTYSDGSIMGYGWLIFPLSKDSVIIDSSGKFAVNTSSPNHNIFYISNGDVPGKVFRVKSHETFDSLQNVSIPDIEFYSLYRKTKKCPICLRNQPIVPVVYGLPGNRLLQLANSGRVILMGCIVPPYRFEYYCKEDRSYF